jgi:hypothetical protein
MLCCLRRVVSFRDPDFVQRTDLGAHCCLHSLARHLCGDYPSILYTSTSYYMGLLLLANHLGLHGPHGYNQLAYFLADGSYYFEKGQLRHLHK